MKFAGTEMLRCGFVVCLGGVECVWIELGTNGYKMELMSNGFIAGKIRKNILMGICQE